MPTITVAITGHGYGHAARTVEVLKAILEHDSAIEFDIRSMVPGWLFSSLPASTYRHTPVALDTGAVERDILYTDEAATLEKAEDFLTTSQAVMKEQAREVSRTGSVLILADVPPLAALIARQAGIPSVGMTNFTWDFIYTNFSSAANHRVLIETLRDWRFQFSRFLQVPLTYEMKDQPNLHQIPLIARKPSDNRDATRQELGIKADERVVLFALRGATLDINLGKEKKPFKVLTFGEARGECCQRLDPNWGARFSDLMAASDVILTKPGYGIVSECIAGRKPIMLMERTGFAETPYIVNALPGLLPVKQFQLAAVHSVLNATIIEDLLRQPIPTTPDLNGAEVAAKHALSMI